MKEFVQLLGYVKKYKQYVALNILSNMLMAIFMVISIPAILNLIPLAVLASILLIVGYKLAKPALFKHMYKQGADQFVPFVVTVTGLVFTDLLTGIGLGLVVGVIIILRRNYNNSHFLHLEETVTASDKHKVNIVLSEEVTFLNKAAILTELNSVVPNSAVTIDMSNSRNIDYDVLEIIDNFSKTAHEHSIDVNLIGRGETTIVDY